MKFSNNYNYSSSTHKLNSNECTLSLSNNSKKNSSNQQSKSNDCPVSLECDKSSSKVSQKKLLQLKIPNQMNLLQHKNVISLFQQKTILPPLNQTLMKVLQQ